MGKVRTDLKDAKQFENMPLDWYPARILRADYIDSKASVERGDPQKQFAITWIITQPGDFLNREIPFFYLSLSPKAAFMREKFLDDIRMERTCLVCNATYNESAKISKEQSKINKAGIGCPKCMSQGESEWDSGTPDGAALLHKACMVKVESRASNRAGDDRKFDTVTDTAPLR